MRNFDVVPDLEGDTPTINLFSAIDEKFQSLFMLKLIQDLMEGSFDNLVRNSYFNN